MLMRTAVPASLTFADFAVKLIVFVPAAGFCAVAGACCAYAVIRQNETIDPRRITADFIEPPWDYFGPKYSTELPSFQVP
jgi:hypothetical protein